MLAAISEPAPRNARPATPEQQQEYRDREPQHPAVGRSREPGVAAVGQRMRVAVVDPARGRHIHSPHPRRQELAATGGEARVEHAARVSAHWGQVSCWAAMSP